MAGGVKSPEEGVVRTGVVLAGVYADKIRKALFAQLSQKIKSGEVDSKEIARAAGEINSLLYDVFVRYLALSKGDLVRIEAPYSLKEGKINWEYSGLKVRAFREIGREVVAKAVEEALKTKAEAAQA